MSLLSSQPCRTARIGVEEWISCMTALYCQHFKPQWSSQSGLLYKKTLCRLTNYQVNVIESYLTISRGLRPLYFEFLQFSPGGTWLYKICENGDSCQHITQRTALQSLYLIIPQVYRHLCLEFFTISRTNITVMEHCRT